MRIGISVLSLALACLAFPVQAEPGRPELIAKIKPSVVTVNVRTPVPDYGSMFPGLASPSDKAEEGNDGLRKELGSGFFVDADRGLIVVAAFIVKDAKAISVTLSDGRKLPAKIVGSDEATEVAVISVGKVDAPALIFCPVPPKAGEEALALGSAFGLNGLVYSGIVAGSDAEVDNNGPYLILDLNIQKGMAGAPVVSPAGCVTGMAIAQYGNGSMWSGSNLGIAVPGQLVQTISRGLIDKGRIARGWLGVMLGAPDEIGMDSDGVESGGVAIIDVPEGPAKKAGFRRDDVIVGYDGTKATSNASLTRYIQLKMPGDTVTFQVRRKSETLTIPVTLGDAPPPTGG